MTAHTPDYSHLPLTQEIARLNAVNEQMAEALKAARSSIDVSLIRPTAKATAHWERIADIIDAALAAAKVQR